MPYRVLNMATEELGAAAFCKFDTEVWMPSKEDFGEICSASNCTSYQSRRLNICYLDKSGERKLAHTVNGTALAVPRILLSILEAHYDGEKVNIPAVLHKFLPFTTIEKNRQSLIHN